MQGRRVGYELPTGNAEQRVCEAIAGPAAWRSTLDRFGARLIQDRNALLHRVGHTLGKQRADRCGMEFFDDRFDERIGLGALEQDDHARVRAKLARPHQATGGELGGKIVAALVDRPRQHDHGIHTRQLQIDRLSSGVGGRLQCQTGRAPARVARGAVARVRHQSRPVGMAQAVDQLHGGGRHAGLVGGRLRFLGQKTRCARMG